MINDDELNDLISSLNIEELRDLKSRFSALIFERICFLKTHNILQDEKIKQIQEDLKYDN
jgi:hypothetical protein